MHLIKELFQTVGASVSGGLEPLGPLCSQIWFSDCPLPLFLSSSFFHCSSKPQFQPLLAWRCSEQPTGRWQRRRHDPICLVTSNHVFSITETLLAKPQTVSWWVENAAGSGEALSTKTIAPFGPVLVCRFRGAGFNYVKSTLMFPGLMLSLSVKNK